MVTKDGIVHPPLKENSMVGLLNYRADISKNKIAYTFLINGEDEAESLTYSDLDLKARALASHLQKMGMEGERALLLFPQGLDYMVAFWGCLYAGVIAIPMSPPSNNQRSLSRVTSVIEDSGCLLALSTDRVLTVKKRVIQSTPELAKLDMVSTDHVNDNKAADWKRPKFNSTSTAYLQYTSGSTSDPKGAIITHGNLLHNLRMMLDIYQYKEEEKYLSWAPFFHDMGLIMGALMPLYAGITVILMSPAAFSQKPFRWLKAISDHKINGSQGSNFAFEFCADRIDDEQKAQLDLSSWRIAVNGAEPVRADTLERFNEAFCPYGYSDSTHMPGYGLAEATLVVSCGHEIGEPPKKVKVNKQELEANSRVILIQDNEDNEDNAAIYVSCGRIYKENHRVEIVDPNNFNLCDKKSVGEVWVAGDSVAHGYWSNVEETNKVFRAHIKGDKTTSFLRTGDLGFILDGELYITGRIKDVIIVRGRNIYPQDIELTMAESHPGLKADRGVAFSVDVEDEEKLVVLQEVDRGAEGGADEIISSIRSAIVEEHEIQPHEIVLLKPGGVYKTTSGKVQRRACRQAYMKNQLRIYTG